jgi:hypothetical protein
MIAPAIAMVGAWALMWATADDAVSDMVLYDAYATLVRDGMLPYRDFPFEYPPLALAPISAGSSELLFGLLMLVAMLVVQREAGLLGGPRAAWILVALPVAIGALARTRFDLVPVALMLAGLRRNSNVLLGLGAATKLFPVLAVRSLRGLAVAGLTAAAVCLPFVLLSPDGFVDQFRFHLDRPVQIESTPGSVLWALGSSHVTGQPVRPDPFRSNGLDGGPADEVALLFTALQLAAIVLSLRIRDRVLSVFAAVLAFAALGRVLSPQYMLWLAPLAAVAYTRGARAPALAIGAAVLLTRIEFPGRYWELVAGETSAVVLVGVRNALLVGALVMLLAPGAAPARWRRPAAAASSG